MAVTNGYATLAEIKYRMLDAHTYTALTIAFVQASSKITDSAKGLKRFQTGMRITISGTDDNDGAFTVATGDVAAEIVTAEALTEEAVGDTVIITDVTNPISDAVLESGVEAASRAIDAYTGRRFYQADETRYYKPEDGDVIFIDDFTAISALASDDDGDGTYENAWAATDYVKLPSNAALDSEPYTMVEVAAYGDYSFPVGVRKGAKVTGTFGYSASAPVMIKEVCLLLAQQIFKRKDAIFGTVGSVGGEQIMAMAADVLAKDPHLKLMITPYVRLF